MILPILIIVSVAMGLVGLVAFVWAVGHDQFEDLDGAASRVLFTDARTERPPHPEGHGSGRSDAGTHRGGSAGGA